MPLLWKLCTLEPVQPGLHQMNASSSPGDDGVEVSVYQRFSAFFAPHTLQAYGAIERGGLPDAWVVALVCSLAKEPGSAAVDAQRPIALP